MRVLITGGTGFLGGHLITALLGLGHQVRVLARSKGAEPACEWVQGSILDRDALGRSMDGCEVVYHLAGRVDRDRRALASLRELHVEGTRGVCEIALKQGVKRMIYASTSGVIGVSTTMNPALDESAPYPKELVASWPYYATKLEAEQVALGFASGHGLPLLCLNPSLLLGPGDTRGSSTGDVADILQGKVPAIPSGSINFVDVRDVAAAAVSALERGEPGERYLLGSANWSLKRFIRTVSELGGVRAPRLPAPGRLSRWSANLSAPIFERVGMKPPLDPVSVEMSLVHWCFSSGKAMRELHFTPRGPVETLRDTLASLAAPG
jgi:dihydroflavonol-4-reductase